MFLQRTYKKEQITQLDDNYFSRRGASTAGAPADGRKATQFSPATVKLPGTTAWGLTPVLRFLRRLLLTCPFSAVVYVHVRAVLYY